MKQSLFVIDSGIGGLSVLRELMKIRPDERYSYLADQAYFPYGDRPAAEIENRVLAIARWVLPQNPLGLVVACNTGTVHAIDKIRSLYHRLPVFGVEPVVKPLAKYHRAAILTTPATASSLRVDHLRELHHAHHLDIRGVFGLAEAIENQDEQMIKKIIVQLHKALGPDIEALGLSCTHYPLILETFRQAFPQAEIYDPSVSVAAHIQESLSAPRRGPAHPADWFTTGEVLRLKQQVKHYLGLEIKAQSLVL